MDRIEIAIDCMRKHNLAEHTIVWNGKMPEDAHVKLIEVGFGIALLFHPQSELVLH
jgi:hypothetical protein